MNTAHVERLARGSVAGFNANYDTPSAPAVIVVNGRLWFSEAPGGAGTAASLNDDAATIVRRLTAPEEKSS